MLGIEGYLILVLIAVGIVLANFIINRIGRKNKESDNTQE